MTLAQLADWIIAFRQSTINISPAGDWVVLSSRLHYSINFTKLQSWEGPLCPYPFPLALIQHPPHSVITCQRCCRLVSLSRSGSWDWRSRAAE